jgi:hypothetical protein
MCERVRILSDMGTVSCQRASFSGRRSDLTTIPGRLRRVQTRKSMLYPTKVDDFPMQVFATATAITREMSYPQAHPGGWFAFFRPLSSGRVILILCYCAILIYMLTNDVVVNDAYYWERVGFRGAWISVTVSSRLAPGSLSLKEI